MKLFIRIRHFDEIRNSNVHRSKVKTRKRRRNNLRRMRVFFHLSLTVCLLRFCAVCATCAVHEVIFQQNKIK